MNTDQIAASRQVALEVAKHIPKCQEWQINEIAGHIKSAIEKATKNLEQTLAIGRDVHNAACDRVVSLEKDLDACRFKLELCAKALKQSESQAVASAATASEPPLDEIARTGHLDGIHAGSKPGSASTGKQLSQIIEDIWQSRVSGYIPTDLELQMVRAARSAATASEQGLRVGEPVCLTHKDQWDHERGQRKPEHHSAVPSSKHEWNVTKDSHFVYLKCESFGSWMFPVEHYDALEQVCRCINAMVGKPDSASTGKLLRECHPSEKGAVYLSGTNVNGYFVEVAATPSGGGEKWTCKDGVVYFAPHKGWPMCYKKHAREVVDAHNATLQPQSDREAIDAAMRKEKKLEAWTDEHGKETIKEAK